MICPACGQEVPEQKFCVNCGNPLVDAASQQVYQASPAPQMPPQADQFGQQAGEYAPLAGSPQPPTHQTAQAFPMNQAPNAAFVLAIVGLVLSCLFVTFLPGLVCSIVGLALNASYNKKGLDNPRKTVTTVLGVVGIVIGAACLVITIVTAALAVQVADELDRQGIDITTDSVEVTTDSDGHVNITVKDDDSSRSVSDASGAGSSSGAATSSSGSASSRMAYDQSKYHDSDYNPTLYALLELTGSEFQDLLEFYNFMWDDDIASWYASDGSLFGVDDASGSLDESQISQLPAGAAGQPVVQILVVEGYDTPSKAFSALSNGVKVENSYDGGDVLFAVVQGTPAVRYLVAVSQTDTDEQTFLLFTEESISSGLFEQLTDTYAGSSIDEVWKVVDGA